MWLSRTTPSSAVQAPPGTSAKGSCEMTSSQRLMHVPALSHRFSRLLPPRAPTAPASLPRRRHTPGPASAGSGASNWKGELQSTKAYQQAAGESSAAVLGAPARGLERVGSLLFGSTGWTRTAAPPGVGTTAAEAGARLAGQRSLLVCWGCRGHGEQRGSGKLAQLRAPTLPGCFQGGLRYGFLASEVPPRAATMHTEVAAIFSYIFYSLTE